MNDARYPRSSADWLDCELTLARIRAQSNGEFTDEPKRIYKRRGPYRDAADIESQAATDTCPGDALGSSLSSPDDSITERVFDLGNSGRTKEAE